MTRPAPIEQAPDVTVYPVTVDAYGRAGDSPLPPPIALPIDAPAPADPPPPAGG